MSAFDNFFDKFTPRNVRISDFATKRRKKRVRYDKRAQNRVKKQQKKHLHGTK